MNVDNLEKTLDNIRAWILAVDQKTNIVFVLELTLITLIAKPTYNLIELVEGKVGELSLFLLAASFVLVGASLIKLMAAIKPRVKAKGVDSLIFFGFVASRKLDKYKQDVAKSSAKSYKADLVTQIHTTSVISSDKHRNYTDGMMALLLAVTVWICFAISIGWTYYDKVI